MAKKIDFSYGSTFQCKLEVDYFSEFMRGIDGSCALCKGDPCLEDKQSKNKNLKNLYMV